MGNVKHLLFNNIGMDYYCCPFCNEKLKPHDLEEYARCPYCDEVLLRDDEMEDFVLSPVVEQWVNSQNKQE